MRGPEIIIFLLSYQVTGMQSLEMCVLGLCGGNQDMLTLLLVLPWIFSNLP